MSRATTGWLWVAGQVVVLGLIILLPGGDDWATSGWLRAVAMVLLFVGFVLMLVASLRLGRSLTPTPVPTASGSLTTSGLYQFVRHPIYTGVLAVVAGMTLRSGSWIHLVVAVCAFAFFNAKAAWEEQQLAERYPEYLDYAARTPRFFPRP